MRHYAAGQEPVPGFQLLSCLGGGEFSSVWRARAPGGTLAALKIVTLTGGHTLKEVRSLQLSKRIRHPNLVPLLAFWLKNRQGHFVDDQQLEEPAVASEAVELIIAMGLGDQTLADRLRECQTRQEPGIPTEELLRHLADAARAIDFLNQPHHDLGAEPVAIQHCDIKPSNILVVGGAAQVCDLGVVRVVGDPRITTPVGSAAYMAPEVLREGKPSATTDQYALAITYYELRTGQLPFQAESSAGAYFAHLQGKLNFGRVSVAEHGVLARATAQRPGERFPTCSALVEALRQACNMAGVSASCPRQPATVGSIAAADRAPPTEPEDQGGLPPTDFVIDLPVAGADEEQVPLEAPVPEDFRGADPEECTPRTEQTHPPAGKAARRRSRMRLMLLVLAGVGIGLAGAWLTRGSSEVDAESSVEPSVFRKVPAVASNSQYQVVPPLAAPPAVAGPPTSLPFILTSNSQAYGSLHEAVAAAVDGDTVTIHGNGPFLTEPLQVQGKALTLKAAGGARPVLLRTTPANSLSWQPLLASDRALTLEGLELRRDPTSTSRPGEIAYLVSCQQASLRMSECRLLEPYGSATVVCRDPGRVELQNCVLVAHAVPLCVEVGRNTPCAIQLTSNAIQIADPSGAALSLYADPERHPAAAVRLHLEHNRVRAGRVTGLKGLWNGVHIEARHNDFTFHEALLSYVDFRRPAGWRQATSWHGRENRYHGSGDWVRVEGVPAGVHGLQEWRALWNSPETGSSSAGLYPGSQTPATAAGSEVPIQE